jgi:hypothetical protein
MLACTGHVTQGKLGVSDARSPPTIRADNLGMASTSPPRKPGIERKITDFVIEGFSNSEIPKVACGRNQKVLLNTS